MSKQFINEIKDFAIKLYKNGGNVLPSVTIAQAILESGWGGSELSRLANNLFGVKGSYRGNYVIMKTKEYENGKWITIDAMFAKYPSIYESLVEHDNLFDNMRYADVRITKDYKEQCYAIYRCGYATDPNYPEKLLQIIKENNLTQYDNIKDTNQPRVSNENKRFKVLAKVLNVRDYPSTKTGKVVAQYYEGEIFFSNGVLANEGYVWRRYQSYKGDIRYIATNTKDNKEKYAINI